MDNHKPLVTGTNHTLPFNRLSPDDFERMCLWLTEHEGYEQTEHLGSAGNEQGRDILAKKDGKSWAIQCKRVKRFGPKDACGEVDKIFTLPEDEWPDGVLFIVSCNISAKTRQRVCNSCLEKKVECKFWELTKLDQKIKRFPNILKEFFQIADKRRNLQITNYSEFDTNGTTKLSEYLDKMTELLLEKGLRKSDYGDEIRVIARARTLTTLQQGSPEDKRVILLFLYEASLLSLDDTIVNLDGANLQKAKLNNINLSTANLNGVDLYSADFRGSSLIGTSFEGSDLRETDFRWTRLQWVNLRWASLDDTTRIGEKWHLLHSITSKGGKGKDLQQVNLSKCNLEEVDLRNANLSEANLSKIHATSIDLSGANLNGCNLSGAFLNNTKFIASNLGMTNLSASRLIYADFTKAILEHTDLRNADLRGATFKGTDLTGTNLEKAHYNTFTVWPENFDPQKSGAILYDG